MTKRRRRWFSFSLAACFAAVTFASAFFWWYGQQRLPFDVSGSLRRDEIRAILTRLSNPVELRPEDHGVLRGYDRAQTEPVLSMQRRSADEILLTTGTRNTMPPGGGETGRGHTVTFKYRQGLWQPVQCTTWGMSSYQ